MPVVVIGAGLLGVTTAYFLARSGIDVCIIDSNEEVAQGASFANGSMLTPSLSEPWNSPEAVIKLAQWAGRNDAPLAIRSGALASLVGWGARFILASRPKIALRTAISNFRLASYSLSVMAELRRDLPLNYDQSLSGTLKVFRCRDQLDKAWRNAAWQREIGGRQELLNREATVALDPALAELGHLISGSIYSPQDESGDARKFCLALSQAAAELGCKFLMGTQVKEFIKSGQNIVSVVSDKETIRCDAVVVAAGAYSSILARLMGFQLQVRPAKGYSLTCDRSRWENGPRLPIIDDNLHAGVIPVGDRIRVAGLADFDGYNTHIIEHRKKALIHLMHQMFPRSSQNLSLDDMTVWSGLRPVSADGAPIIGRVRQSNIYVNTGHGHLGWTLAAGSAKLLTDIILEKSPGLNPDPYRFR